MVLNERYPHSCRVYRLTGVTPFSDGERTLLYEGKCRKYSGYRPTDPDGVSKELFALSLPMVYGNGDGTCPKEGDVVEITGRGGEWTGRVTSVMAGNLGTTLHWEDVKR